MQVNTTRCKMKTDGFLPRPNYIECYHQPGNSFFGIKFKVSPIIFEKKVNFSDYSDAVFPLSYLVDAALLDRVKKTTSFEKRVQLLKAYYEQQLDRYEGSLQPVNIVTSILDSAAKQMKYNSPVEELASQYHISSRTLQRYFLSCTGMNSKQALQVLRIRRAVNHMLSQPESFHYNAYDYYDFSHFYKHLKQFLHTDALGNIKPHLQLLRNMRRETSNLKRETITNY